MSGETESHVSAWTVDSLREHMENVIKEKDECVAERDQRYDQRFESQEKALRIAFDAQALALTTALAGMRELLEERDRRYQERFEAAEKAVIVALNRTEKEFHEHIQRVREETTVAMVASDKAITKSEIANEKRFESVNEFRAQQADMIQTFARKTEVDSQLAGLTEKINANQASTLQLAGSTLPRNEYDRAHVDLADKVVAVDKALNEKLEVQTKAIEARIALLQNQVTNVEAITR